jgi:DNA-binding XRE family transcriptional regulator
MMNYELINDETGKPAFAKVPIDDLQDMQDAIEAAAIRGRIERGEEDAFPADVVHAVLDGENPVHAYRKFRGLTQAALAGAAGLKQPAIARAEAGGTTSVAALKAIADVLRVDMEMLIVTTE